MDALLKRRMMMMAGSGPTPPGPSPLPEGYTLLSYVENPLGNSAYINTRVNPGTQTGFVIDAMSYDELGGSGYGCIFGGRYSSGNADFQLTSYTTSGNSGTLRTGTNSYNAHLPAKNTRFTAQLSGTTYSIGGNDYSITYNVNSSRAAYVYIFALHSGSSVVQNGHGRIYSLSFYQGGNKIRDYVPCKNPNNVVGFYDLVSESFVGPTSGTLVGVE